MIHTRICDLLGITHPVILGGMGTATTAPLVAAVSNAGGFGTLGTSAFNAATLESEVASIRERTEKPFGINHLLFQVQEDMFAVTLRASQSRVGNEDVRRAHQPRSATTVAFNARISAMTALAPALARRASRFGPAWLPPTKPTEIMPAAVAAATPAGESSTTMHSDGATPILDAA